MPVTDCFIDYLANTIHEDLFEPWREIDAQITSFCPCSLTLPGACSAKNRPRARRSRSRSCRRAERGKGSDPDPPRSCIAALNAIVTTTAADVDACAKSIHHLKEVGHGQA